MSLAVWLILILFLCIPLAVGVGGCGLVYNTIGGSFKGTPAEMNAKLSPGAKQLIDEAFRGIDPERFADLHVHLFSSDFNPEMVSIWHPFKRFRSMVFASASQIEFGPQLEEQFVKRLTDLVDHMPLRPRCYLYALDHAYKRDGTIDDDRRTMYVSNDAVLKASAARPDIFVPVASIHPYRLDAIAELERCAAGGCRHVKWLPSMMGIDPSDEKLDAFYKKMHELNIVLLTHTGKEHSVEVIDQGLSNPLLLRRPLDIGVTVVALHAASDGNDVDLDDPARKRVPSFDLFLRLMAEPRYEGLLFGETSAMLFYYHLDVPIKTLLSRPDLQRRFVNGSDYPFCALNWATPTSKLVKAGLITSDERRYLNEIYGFNPLLFDFVAKRTIRDPQTGRRLDDSVFMLPEVLR